MKGSCKSAVREAMYNRGQSCSPLCKKGREKNKIVKRQIKPTCSNCRNHCTQVIKKWRVSVIFSDYCQYLDLTKWWQFITDNVTSLSKKRKRGESKKHSFAYKYSLNRIFHVKLCFFNTLHILEKTVHTVWKSHFWWKLWIFEKEGQ